MGKSRREKKPGSVFQRSLPLDGGRLPIGYVALDRDGHVLDVNPKWYEILGYSVDEVRGHLFGDFVAPDSRATFRQRFTELPSRGEVLNVELSMVHKDGRAIRVLFNGTVERGPSGEIKRIHSFLHNVSELLSLQQEAEQSEARFRELFDCMGSCVAVYEARSAGEDFVFVDFNSAAERADAALREDVVGKSVLKVYPRVREFGLFEVFQRVWRTGNPEHHPLAEYRGERIHGWRENYVYKLPSGEIVAIYDDVTERKQAEAERELVLKRQLAVNRITFSLGAATGLETTLRTLHNELRALLDADGLFISRYDKDTGLIAAVFVVDEGVERDVSTLPAIPLASEGKRMQSQVLRTGQPLNVPNWIERERTMQTVFHIASDGALTAPPPEGAREGCTKSALLVPMMLQGESVGVLQVQSNRLNAYSDEDVKLLAGVANVAAISIQDALLVEEVRLGLEGTIDALARTTEMRDPYTAGHQLRVSQLARAMAEKMGLAEKTAEGLRVSGLLHDVGKVSVSAEILSKPSMLTPNELSLVKEHVMIGFGVLKGIAFPWPVAEVVLQHHERLDGSGYPRGLTKSEIYLEAKILAVADVVEAMASHRPYRPARGINVALEEIREHQGKLYDSDAVEACVQLFGDGFEFAPAEVDPSS